MDYNDGRTNSGAAVALLALGGLLASRVHKAYLRKTLDPSTWARYVVKDNRQARVIRWAIAAIFAYITVMLFVAGEAGTGLITLVITVALSVYAIRATVQINAAKAYLAQNKEG